MTAVSAWVVAGMVTTEVQAAEGAIVAQRWLARLALVAAVAVLVPPVVADLRESIGLGLAGLGLTLAWAWWALAVAAGRAALRRDAIPERMRDSRGAGSQADHGLEAALA